MPPLLRTEGGAHAKQNSAAYFYAKRLRTRSTRYPKVANVPLRVGVPVRAAKEEQFSTRLDVLGPLLSQHYPVVPDGSRANLLAAFDKRCNFYTDARCDRSIVKSSIALLNRIAPSAWDPLDWTPELFHEWNSMHDASKQARHLKCLPVISEVTSKQFTAKQIFVKVEALLKRHDSSWAPRVIYQSSDLHNCILGPIMWKCTKRMFLALEHDNPSSSVSYMGGYSKSGDELCSRLTRHGNSAKFIESDFSSNDMMQVRDVHLLEIKWLRRFGAPLWLTGLMLHANSFAVSSRKHGVSARIENQLPTGAQSTTFRNTMWNLSINYAFVLRVGATGDCLVLGDDMLFRYDNPISSRVKNIRREYEHVCRLAHMEAKVKVRSHLSECEFLSKQFIMTDHGFVLVPKLGKAVARFNARASSNESVSDRSYLAGKALSYAFEFRFLPPISKAFLLRYEQLVPSEGVSLDGLGWNAKGAFKSRGVSGVLAALSHVRHPATRDDATRFYHWRYSLFFQDVLELVLATLFREEDLDEVGIARILEDFV